MKLTLTYNISYDSTMLHEVEVTTGENGRIQLDPFASIEAGAFLKTFGNTAKIEVLVKDADGRIVGSLERNLFETILSNYVK